MVKDWETFFLPYEQAVAELKIKLKGIRKQFREKGQHSPIEFVTGRVKPQQSVNTKVRVRGMNADRLETEMTDIAGLRIMCQFVDDIYNVVALIKQRKDMTVINELDYIANKKESGYRSYHLIISYPVQSIEGEKIIYAEIQIRTLAMNFWATIEHSLNYKYQGDFPEEIKQRLKNTAEAAYLLDEEMSEIREEIQEAQHLFIHEKDKHFEEFYSSLLDQYKE